MARSKYPALDTLALHAGSQPDSATGARATPIYQNDIEGAGHTIMVESPNALLDALRSVL